MNSQGAKNENSQFIKTDSGKTKSNAIEAPSVSLPKGGGALKGIDEKFSVNAVNGTASLSFPLPFASARGAVPSLNLSYSSGAGNGVFGLGWNIGLASIRRKTDKGLPQYFDAIESDVFLFSEAEDLVPVFKKESDGSFSADAKGNYLFDEMESPDHLWEIRRYRPRTEGLFARIERWINKADGIIKWRVITKDNLTTLFGWTAQSRLADPLDARKVFEWLPEFVFDDKGNCAHYRYKAEDGINADTTSIHNKNRLKSGAITYTNLYLEKILYGNKTPYRQFGDAYPVETEYLFQTVLDHGEYEVESPYAKTNDWAFRADAFSDYKAGFEIRTTRLCRRVLQFHYFNGQSEYQGLVKSLDINYDTGVEQDFSFVKGITSCGYIKKPDGTYSVKKLPATEFTYQKHAWSQTVRSVTEENLVHAPTGLDEQQYQFTDLYNEGLSGILTEQANGWYYKHNLGNGKFERAKLVTPKPALAGLGGTFQLSDLDADGRKQLASYSGDTKGYFEFNDDDEWGHFRLFETLPNINLGDPNTRMLDLNGDGKPDILITEESVFTWYESTGKKGYAPARKTVKPFDEETGPAIVFSDARQTLFLADMSGDGLSDIVRIRNGEVCYWPNLGYGKFGTKVAMDNAPVFDNPDAFNPSYLKLADIDGSGTPDIIYLGKNKFTCWLNLSGNRFSSTPFEITAFPDIHSQSKISVTDLLGNGVACFVWSSALAKDGRSPLRYIDLMDSKKPHIMVGYKNNFGKEVALEYKPSTYYYLQDKLAGKPWITKLHFPVHCVAKTETRDTISGCRFVSSYSYHHGYYDHPEREFRGFGMVEQTDAESYDHWALTQASNLTAQDLHQQPVVTKSWFHTGAFLTRHKILGQFAHEYWYEEMAKQGFTVTHPEQTLPEARITAAQGIAASTLDHLSGEEWQQALRACKGMALRSEVFAHDAPAFGATPAQIQRQLTPYTVATHNCNIELLQPKGQNRFAVYVVKESEAITYSYERNVADPRIAHSFNLKLDEYGNVLESAAVVYPRLVADTTLPASTQGAQNQTTIIYTQNQFTNDVEGSDTHRLRLPSEVTTYELKGLPKANLFYKVSDFDNALSAAEIAYHEVDTAPTSGTQKRLIEHVRSCYYKDDLAGPLPLHTLESKALPFESYQQAYSPELVDHIFGNKVDDALMQEGKFKHSEGDSNWWISSGTTRFKADAEVWQDAQKRFYAPIAFIDPYGSETKVSYYSNYFLFINKTEDAVGNQAQVDQFNFRTLAPQRMRDPNGNLTAALADELGLVKAMAVYGKGTEADDLDGLLESTDALEAVSVSAFFQAPDSTTLTALGKDLLQHATARFVYDFDAYKNTGKPSAVASIVREEHFQKSPDSPVQISFQYSNGLGKVAMKKVQAEPGLAKSTSIDVNGTITVNTVDTSSSTHAQLRWIGNGRTVLNNKGNPVKQYEPYFSVSHQFEDLTELVESGVSPVMYYDAMGRMVKTIMPDGTLLRSTFDAWQHAVWDANDTVLESSWYNLRFNRLIDAELLAAGKDPVKEQAAAAKAALHANTPTVQHLDSLGRPVLSIDHNRQPISNADEFYATHVHLDTEGNLRRVTDARGNAVMQYQYDMLGHLVYQNSMDAGQRWLLINSLEKPLRTWDERNHEFQYFYDALHRPLHSEVLGGDGSAALGHVFERIVYGETQAMPEANNLRGQVYRHYDTGGLQAMPSYAFNGKPVTTHRQLFKRYKDVANWVDANLVADLEPDLFTFTTHTDALGRISQQTAPDGSTITPSYNEAGLLNAETVLHPGAAVAQPYLKNIDYNEKGQRQRIVYGNDVATDFEYDPQTFRLQRLTSVRQNGDPTQRQLQDWHYTFDPSGNISHIEDQNSPTVFFNNQIITSTSAYVYDALYRLVEATGRENAAPQVFDGSDNWNDAANLKQLNPGDPLAMRNYTQSYQYDSVGNIQRMHHVAAGNSWTRDYAYQSSNNRLVSTQVGSHVYQYPHHAQHGYITQLPHLSGMAWNFKEELVRTSRQVRNDGGTPETTYYQYDGQGQRIRKITENTANPGDVLKLKEERIYIAGYELYIKHSGNDKGLERTSLSLLDDGHRFVMVETRNAVDDGTQQQLVHYQLHNHLGSAALELDTNAEVISYEEFHPFGTTAYQAKNSAIQSSAKRYRYTGMERDEESGLSYHSARYYLPWLGRWLSGDPIGIGDGVNIYAYVRNNPKCYFDSKGKDRVPSLEKQKNPKYALIVVDIAKETAYLYTKDKNNKLTLSDSVSVKTGDASGEAKDGYAKTSIGLYKITEIHKDYTTIKYPEKNSETTFGSAFGAYTLKMGPNAQGQWMHGTTALGTLSVWTGIGQGSHGCIRTSNTSITDIANGVNVGTPILRIYTKNENPYGFKNPGKTTFDPNTATLASDSSINLLGPAESPKGGINGDLKKLLTNLGINVKIDKPIQQAKTNHQNVQKKINSHKNHKNNIHHH